MATTRASITRKNGSVLAEVPVELYEEKPTAERQGSWRGMFRRSLSEAWVTSVGETLSFRFVDGRTGSGCVSNVHLRTRPGYTQLVEVTGTEPLR